MRTKKVNKLLNLQSKFNKRKNKEYKIEILKNTIVDVNKIARGQFLGLYYLNF